MEHFILSNRKEQGRATLFALFVILLMVGGIAVSFASSGPIVLGTELNANGGVEYLCMGKGCADFTQFTWNDK